jgi:predicted transcriptional regulator
MSAQDHLGKQFKWVTDKSRHQIAYHILSGHKSDENKIDYNEVTKGATNRYERDAMYHDALHKAEVFAPGETHKHFTPKGKK